MMKVYDPLGLDIQNSGNFYNFHKLGIIKEKLFYKWKMKHGGI